MNLILGSELLSSQVRGHTPSVGSHARLARHVSEFFIQGPA